jgi:uncharacterized protein (DUF111 family)
MSRRSSTGSEKARGTGRVLHLDLFSGIAGNMLLGALLDAGLPRKQLEADLAGLGLDHDLVVRRVRRGVLSALYVDVKVPAPRHTRATSPLPRSRTRALVPRDRVVLEKAKLAPEVRARALACFEALARAEARVHGTSGREGALPRGRRGRRDRRSHGAAIGLSRLGVTRVTASPAALGRGAVDTEHGRLPLPSPATLELLRGLPTVPAHVEWETVTPTGAALPAHAGRRVLRPARDDDRGDRPRRGQRPQGGLPNVVRAVLDARRAPTPTAWRASRRTSTTWSRSTSSS